MAPTDVSEPPSGRGEAYAWYVVSVLMLTFAVAYIDRQILSLLVEPLKRDLGVSDTQIGLLAGLAFAAFYTVLGVPIARLSDRGNRVRIISAGVAVWSLMTAICGLASSYSTLFLARIGVGAGEATVGPASYSIIADYFPPERVARAVGVYIMGVYLGVGLAMIGGSAVVRWTSTAEVFAIPVIGDVRAWQLAFLLAALPGVLALALLATVREPARRQYLEDGSSREIVARRSEWHEVATFLRTHRALFGAWTFGSAAAGTVITAFFVWVPELLRRSHGMGIADAGLLFGILLVACGAPGSSSAGWAVGRLRLRGHRDAEVRAALYCCVLILPLGIAAAVAPSAALATLALAPLLFLMGMAQALTPAVVQLISPNHLRAQLTALFTLVAVLIGATAGPTVVAMIADFVFRDEKRLGTSLAIVVAALMPIAIALYRTALRPFVAARTPPPPAELRTP